MTTEPTLSSLEKQLIEANDLVGALWPLLPNDEQVFLQSLRALLPLVQAQVATAIEGELFTLDSPIHSSARQVFDELNWDDSEFSESGKALVIGLRPVLGAYTSLAAAASFESGMATSIAEGRLTGYVVLDVDERSDANDLIDRILDLITQEVDKGQLDDEAVGFLENVITPMLQRLKALLTEEHETGVERTRAVAESKSALETLSRISRYGKKFGTKTAAGATAATLVLANADEAVANLLSIFERVG